MEAYQVIERNIEFLKSIITCSDYVRMMSMGLFTLADAKVVDIIYTYLPNITLGSLDRCSYCRLSTKHPFISLTSSTKRFAHLAPPLPLHPLAYGWNHVQVPLRPEMGSVIAGFAGTVGAGSAGSYG